MAISRQRLRDIYDVISENGYQGDYDSFEAKFSDHDNQNNYQYRLRVFATMRGHGATDAATYEDFMKSLQPQSSQPKTPQAPAPRPTQPSQQNADSKPAANAEQAKQQADTMANLQQSYHSLMQRIAPNKQAKADGNSTASLPPAQQAPAAQPQPQTPAPTWKPTQAQKIEMASEVQRMTDDAVAGISGGSERIARVVQTTTPEWREQQRIAEQVARMAGADVSRPLGLNPGASADETAEGGKGKDTKDSKDTRNIFAPRTSPQVVGHTYDKKGNVQAVWQLGNGDATTDRTKVEIAEFAARQARQADKFANRMKANGLNPAKAEDIQKQVSNDQFDINHADLIKRKTDLEAELRELYNRREQEEQKQASKRRWWEEIGHAANEANRNMHPTSSYVEFPIDAAIRDKQAELIKIERTLRRERQAASAADGNWFSNLFKGIGSALTDIDTYTFGAYSASANKRVNDAIKAGGTATEEQKQLLRTAGVAQEQQDKIGGLGIYDTGAFVGGMMASPEMWAGALAGKAISAPMRRLLFGKASEAVVGRMLPSARLWRRAAMASGSGAANFAAFEGVGNARQQLINGGEFSIGDVVHSTIRGSVLGATTGVVGSLIGNVGDKVIKSVNSTPGKAASWLGKHVVSAVAEGTIFAVPQYFDPKNKMDWWDVEAENISMIFGMKLGNKAMGTAKMASAPMKAGQRLRSLLKGDGKTTFSQRLRAAIEASPVKLTQEERNELAAYGYGSVEAMLRRRKGDIRDENGRRSVTADYADDVAGYDAINALMSDPNVSEAARAKVYYIVTGHTLPMHAVMGWNIVENNDRYVVESTGAGNQVITRRVFGSRDAVDAEVDKIRHQVELNSLELGERVLNKRCDDEILRAALKELYPNVHFDGFSDLYSRYKQGEDVGAQGRSMIDAVEAKARSEYNTYDDARPQGLRRRIAEDTGIDIDEVVAKKYRDRSEDEQAALQRYLRELFGVKEQEEQQAEPTEATKRIEGGDDATMQDDTTPPQDGGGITFGNGSTTPPQDIVRQEAVDAMNRAYDDAIDTFGENTEQYASVLNDDPLSLLDSGTLNAEQEAAVLAFYNARERARRAAADDDPIATAEVVSDIEGKAHRRSGVLIPATMRDGREVYVVQGDVVANEDGSINIGESSDFIIVADANTGEITTTSPRFMTSRGEAIEMQVAIDRALQQQAANQQGSAAVNEHDGDEASDSSDGARNQYDRTVPATEAEKISAIRRIIDIAKHVKDKVERAVIGGITKRQSEDFTDLGLKIDGTWVHSIENSAITHNQNHHGDAKREEVRGQIAITEDDYAKIPDILENYDKVSVSPNKNTGAGNDVIIYEKEYGDGYIYYLEEKRDKRKSLAFQTMYKKKKGADSSDGLLPNATPSTSKAPSDNLSDLSASKGSENGGEMQAQVAENAAYGELTALQRIPVGDDGEPVFESVDKETAWDGLVEAVGGEADAAEIALAQVQQAATDLETLKKKAPTPKLPKLKGSPMAMVEAKRRAAEQYQSDLALYNQQLAEMQARLEAWNGIIGVYNSRSAERDRQQREERRQRDAQAYEEAMVRDAERKRIEAEKEAEQAAIGTHAVNPKIKAKWDGIPKIEGNGDVITLPDGSQLRGHYILTEAGAASASHDPSNGFVPTEGFPIDVNGQSVNDRDYHRDKDAQRIVNDMAEAYDSRALQSPVVVSQDGIVLSGNNRTMSGDIAARQGTDKAYVDYLREFGAKYGFTREQVGGMRHPRVVFVPEERLSYDAATFSRFNAQEMKSQSKPEAAVKLGKTVPDDVFGQITNIISGYDRLSDFYSDEKAVAYTLGLLLQSNVINDKQMPELRTGAALSAAGKELIENILIGKVFQGNPDAVRQLIEMPGVKQSVVMGLSEIAANRALAADGYDLTEELANAVDLVMRAKAALPDVFAEGVPVSGFGRQSGMFDDEYGDSSVTDAATLLLADILNSGKPSELRKVLASYNKDAGMAAAGQMDIFSGEIESKETILKRVKEHFKNATTKEQQAIVDAAIAERKRRATEQGEGSPTAGQTNNADERGGESRTQTDTPNTVGGDGDRSIEEWFGPVYTQFEGKAKEAEAYLRETNEGVAKGALTYPGVEPIDLVWGDMKAGYMKILIKHPEVVGRLQEILSGTKIVRQSDNRIVFESDTHRMIVSKMKGSTSTDNWLLTAYEKKEKSASASSSDIETEPKGKRNGTATPQNGLNEGKVNTLSAQKQDADAKIAEDDANNNSVAKQSTEPQQPNEPTEAQKAAGNYKVEHRKVDGYNVSIENPKGSVRRGKGSDGKEWETEMHHDYGYIRGTQGVDGDHIDVFLSDTPEQGDVFVVDQVNEDGSFDEHKVMYGFPSEEAAREAYLSNYEPGWTGLGAITHVSKEEFKKWIGSSKRKTKPFAEYKSIKPIEDNSMVGRSLSEQEATDLIARMEANAEVAPVIELTPENWIAQFGEDGTVDTPLGTVKMGANQLLKLYSLKRTEYFGMIHPTLNSPDVIMEKHAPADGAERDSKYLFVKTFIKSDGSRLVHFESVTVKRDGMEVSISSHEAEGKAIKKEMQNSKILHLSESLSLSSERYLTEAPTETEGPDLVPTSDNVSSAGKGNTLSGEKQEDVAKSAENEAQEADGDVDMLDKQGQGASLQWSEKKAANGEPFLIGKNGSIDLVEIPGEVFAAMGIAPAPFRLTPSMVAHVYERHKKELKLKSPEDAVAVVLDVMNNFDHVRRGKDTTFVFSIENGRNKTAKRAVTIVLQYEDGKWIGIKTVGLDRVKSLNELATLWGKGESPSSTAGVATANVTSAQPSEGDRAGGIASNQNAANTNGKGSEKTDDVQDEGGEKGAGTKLEDFGEKIAGARKDALRELSATIEAANVQSFVALPLSKAFRRPSVKKLVEAGVVDENEAKVIEAMSLVILGHRKPMLTRRTSSKRDVEKWAQEQYEAAQVIKTFVEGDKDARAAVIEQLKAEYESGKESGENISPAAFAHAVLERAGLGDMSGYKPVDMWIRKYGKSYAVSAGKGYVRVIGDNLGDAVSAQVAALQIKNGISDVDIPVSMFKVEGDGRKLEDTGAYLVQWMTGASYNTKRFGSKEEAENFAATKKGSAVHAERRFGGYTTYKIRAINPTNGAYVDVDFGIKFESKAEAKTYIEEHLEELSAKVVDEIFAEEKIERKVGRYFEVIKDYRSGDYMVVYKGTCWVRSIHKSIDEARAEAERKSEEYAKLEENKRKIVYFSTDERPRVGKDYRGGKDATPEMFTDAFGFRGVQFGNWTNAKDRQEALNQAYDAFMDLAELLGKSPRAMSLNGELGLAFGSRGSGRALAHYEPDEVVINLTKTKGAGSLAHEWWHALDNYFARRDGVAYGFACEMPSVLRDELRDDMTRLMQATNRSNYGMRCAKMSSYWRSSREVTARLFAEYVSAKLGESGSENSFLSRGASAESRRKFMENNWLEYQMRVSDKQVRYGTKTDYKPMTYDEFMASPMALEGYAYPTPNEIAELKPHIEEFINDIREEEGGAMFHKVENAKEVGAILPAEDVLVDGLVGVLRDAGIETIADAEVGQQVIDAANGDVRYDFASSEEEFESRHQMAVEQRGIVAAGLEQESVTVVDVPRHSFIGSFKEAVKAAEAWARANLTGREFTFGKNGGRYSISGKAIRKFLSQSALSPSENIGVHLAALNRLPQIIENSIDVEIHPDYIKGEDAKRTIENGIGRSDVLVHRLYGCINIDGQLYRVKTTMYEYRRTSEQKKNAPHSYEVTKIELLEAPQRSDRQHLAMTSSNSISVAKLLKGIEKSYDKGKKILDESRKNGVRMHKVYHGSGADFDAFDFSHMGEGEGNQAYGYGGYVTEVEGIGRTYAKAMAEIKYKGLSEFELVANARVASMEKYAAYHVIKRMRDSKSLTANQAIELEIAEIKRMRDYGEMSDELANRYIDALLSLEKKDFSVDGNSTLYTIEVPDDTGRNYLHWESAVGEERARELRERLFEHLIRNDEEGAYEDAASREMLQRELAAISGDVSGADVYGTLSSYLGSGKAASEFLRDNGFVGVSYPAQYKTGGRTDKARNFVIFDEGDMRITDKARFFRTPKGEVYGFTIGGKIYLDPRIATAETPIHEYAHLWAEALRRGNATEWSNVVELMRKTPIWEEVKKKYPELTTDSEIAEEVLAHYSGRRGAERLRQEMRKAIDEADGAMNKAIVARVFGKIGRALSKFWRAVADMLHIHYTSAEEVADRVLYDMLRGFNPKDVAKVGGEGVRYQIVGEKGAASLDKAEDIAAREIGDVDAHKIAIEDRVAQRDYLLSDSYASTLTGGEFAKSNTPLTDRVAQYYAEKYNGKVKREGLGVVVLDKRGVKDSISHGIGRNKSAAFAAVPNIIRFGVLIDQKENWKSRNYDSYTIAAPIKIDGEGYVCIAIVIRGHGTNINKFYLHEVVPQKNLLNESIKTGTKADSHRGDVANILKEIVTAKEDAENLSDDVLYRIREDEPPTKTGIGYKVFVLKDGKLYPPMVANPGGEATPIGVWLDADAAPVAGVTKTGRQQVKSGGKGTQGGSGKLAYRPGWHLGEIPYALQFNRINPKSGQRELFPANFVWAEVEYANDVDYQDEAMSYGMNKSGKFQHSLAGLPRLPKDGSYKYRTNPDPNTDDWIITGAMKVNRILKPSEVDAMVEGAGRKPQPRQAGAVTDAQVESLNREIESSMQGDGAASFEARQQRAVANKGTVMPGLNKAEVKVVSIKEKSLFDTNKKTKALKQDVIAYANKYGIIGTMTEEETKGKGKVTISKASIEKMVDDSATDKSVDKDTHLAVIPQLREVIAESIMAETHPDYIKGEDGERKPENGYNGNVLIHRCYGALNIDGTDYRVKITLKEDGSHKNAPHKAYTYEVTEIELLDSTNGKGVPSTSYTSNSNDSKRANGYVHVAKLLNGVEKSYDNGKKLLDESKKADIAASDKGSAALRLGAKLNTKVNIVSDVSEITNPNAAVQARQRRAKGMYDPLTGEVTIVLPNNADVADVENTALHEIVGHDGLRVLFPDKAKLDHALDELYRVSESGIKATIDATAKRLYEAEVARIMERKRLEHQAKGEDAAAHHYADMAEAHAEASKRREQQRRAATEEYGVNLAGRIGKSGFEKMSAEELTFWGKFRAILQKALSSLRRGLGIKSKRPWTDKEWAFVLHEAYKAKLRGNKRPDAMDMADTAIMRRLTGFGEVTDREADGRMSDNVRFNSELARYKNGNMDKNEMLHLGKPQGVIRQFLPDLPIVMRQRVIKKGSEKKHDVDVDAIMNMPQHLSSPIFVFQRSEDTIGVLTDMKDRNGKNVCVAIELKRQIQNGNEYLEVNDVRSFHGREFKNIVEPIVNNKTLKWVDKEKGLAYLSSASQPVQQEIDKQVLNDAAKVVENFENPKVSGENVDDSDALMYRDGEKSLDEAITEMRVAAMQANEGNLQAKREAMRAIGGNLNHLRQAMARQREYDVATAKSVKDLAQVLMDAGLLSDMSAIEVKGLLKATADAIGRQDISGQVKRVFDIMLRNHLRNQEADFASLTSMRGSRVDARGIQVQGELDADGQMTLSVFNRAKSLKSNSPDAQGQYSQDSIEWYIGDAMDRMSSDNEQIASAAATEYAALISAKTFIDNVTYHKNAEKQLRQEMRKAEQEYKAGLIDKTAFDGIKESIEEAIQQEQMQRIEGYEDVMTQLGGVLGESVERAKAWREAQKEHVRRIQHLANSDMQGREGRGHKTDTRLQKLANNPIVRYVLSPLASLDQMLKMFGSKNANGEGYLWNYYMRGIMDSLDNEQLTKEHYYSAMDEATKRIFGKDKYTQLYVIADKGPSMTVKYYDGVAEREYELSQQALMYLYAVDKMPMGRATNRRMGITDEFMEQITQAITPQMRDFIDWVQEELLPELGKAADEVHQRMFGAHMDAIENYFPFVRDNNAIKRQVENGMEARSNTRISLTTGAIKKRVASVAVWDMRNINFLDVLAKHVDEMVHWLSFAEMNRDLSTLQSYNRFHQQVLGMSSMYGAGETLWQNFTKVCAIATDSYEPMRAAADKTAVQVAKGVTMGKISARPFTALKQTLSLPAFFGDVDVRHLSRSMSTAGIEAMQWAWKNMPNFRKRILSRTIGDYRLKATEYDTKIMKAATYGMMPNIAVDAWTIAIGAHAKYLTSLNKYLQWGMDKDAAHRRAVQDAELCYNKSQQSSEGGFMAPVQVDHSWLTMVMMLFRNASTAYTREVFNSARNLKRITTGQADIDFMAKQWLRTMGKDEAEWTDADWAQARKVAAQERATATRRNSINLLVYGWILPWLWRIGAVAPSLLLLSDTHEKDEEVTDTLRSSMFGPLEGLAYGDVAADGLSLIANNAIDGEWSWNGLNKIGRSNPLSSDIAAVVKDMGRDWVVGVNDILNIVGATWTGVNPQTLTDWVAAIMDASDDRDTRNETALLVARLLNCPQSQLQKLYLEELDMNGDEASRLTPVELAERYAAYKTIRETPMTGWMRGADDKNSSADRARKVVLSAAKDKAKALVMTERNKALAEECRTIDAERKAILKTAKTDMNAFNKQWNAFLKRTDMQRFFHVKMLLRSMDDVVKQYVQSRDAEEMRKLEGDIKTIRDSLAAEAEKGSIRQ